MEVLVRRCHPCRGGSLLLARLAAGHKAVHVRAPSSRQPAATIVAGVARTRIVARTTMMGGEGRLPGGLRWAGARAASHQRLLGLSAMNLPSNRSIVDRRPPSRDSG